MSKRRAVILAVVVEGRTHAEVARAYDVSASSVSRWVARYRVEGDTAFEPRSRRPRTSPNKTPDDVVAAIVELRRELTASGLDAGPATIAWHLDQRHGVSTSVSTIRRYLVAAGLVTPQPKKRPRVSFTRFEAALPNECWQSDVTHWRLATGAPAEIVCWLDDCSRYALSVTAHRVVTGDTVVDTFTECGSELGYPASTLTDNAMIYTTRFSGGRGGRNALETLLAGLGIQQKNSRPNRPTTCGKVERFHQTLKRWLRARPPAATLAELQDHLDDFVDHYNHNRPHRALRGATPAVAYTRLPKTGPRDAGAGTHHRIRRDRVDTTGTISLRRAGRLHHIGIGRAHKHQPVIVLVDDLDIRVIHATTGEILRTLTLDPTRGYQPRKPH